jgi:phage gp36-like protein
MQKAIGLSVLLLIADDNADGVVDTTTVVDPALAAASSFADTFLHAYLPIDIVPDVLRDATVMIAAQMIRLPRDQSTDDSALAYKNAVDWLKLVANGTVILPGGSSETVDDDPGSPELYAEERVWTRTTGAGVF